MVFIAGQALPDFVQLRPLSLKPPRVPPGRWAVQVLLLTAGSLLNNWVYRYHIPLTVQIVFRSAGLAVSMLFGKLVRGKTYSVGQVVGRMAPSFRIIFFNN
jgi:solute carrier family 35 (UDP-xylose/UDP-N-acetylglucosamine transporter), member B4